MKLLDFADHEYINLITYKKDNTSVKTPVWVAEYDSCLVITSSKSAGKVKRINNNGRATIYITDQMGIMYLFSDLNIPFFIKFPLVLFLICFVSLTIYHAVKNFRILIPLFGLTNKKNNESK